MKRLPRGERAWLPGLLTIGLALFGALTVEPARAETTSDCIDKVCLHVSRSYDRVEIEASNGQSVPVGVRLDFSRLVNATAVLSLIHI